MAKRFIGHDWAEVRAADAYIDDIANPLAGVSPPPPVPQFAGEVGHTIEDRMYSRHDVNAIYDYSLRPRRSQGNMQRGALLRTIDRFSPEHRCYALPQLALISKAQQEAQRFSSDPIFRVVEVDSGCF